MVERIGDSKRCKQFQVSEKPTPNCLDNYILIYVVYSYVLVSTWNMIFWES